MFGGWAVHLQLTLQELRISCVHISLNSSGGNSAERKGGLLPANKIIQY